MKSNEELITVLVDVHHRYLREAVVSLLSQIKELADDGDNYASGIIADIEDTVRALDAHFKEEEQNLFPKILRAEKAGTAESGEPGSVDYYEVLVRDLISEHEEARAFLEKVVGWSESLADGERRDDLSGGLITLAVILNAHILIEEELLFPRAEAMFAR